MSHREPHARDQPGMLPQARVLDVIDQVGRALAAELDFPKLVQTVTDAATDLASADFGALRYGVAVGPGDAGLRYTFSGVPEALARLVAAGDPLAPPVDGSEVIRSDDVAQDARFAQYDLQQTVFLGRLPVRSYLAAPLVSPKGACLGSLFLGHAGPARFSEEHEQLIRGVCRYAAVALDNALLYQRAQIGEMANARLAAIVQSSDDAIVSKDLNGIVQSWNAGAERMFGYSAAEMIGAPITRLIPPERPDEEPAILARLRRGERVDHFETVRVRKDGRLIDVSVTISPVRDAAGNIVGASKVAREITERKRVEAEREELLAAERAARGEAERHSRMKDEFLATLSHELRTPLNAVLGWAALLRRHETGDQELRHGLEVIERNARLQGQLIEDLLDMSRIISGKLRLSVQRVELSTVIEAALETIRPAANAKGVRLERVLDPLAGPVSGDPNRLQQVIWNLLSNAVKFTPRGGKIQILLERVNSHVEVSIVDNGQGIAPEFLPQVFDRFRQADASTTRQHGGLGLGLAIVRHLTELHGGTVRAKSPGVGQGATFTLLLPVRAVHKDDPAPVPAQLGERTALQDVPLAGLRAVVVDDEADAREIVRRMLEDAQVSVRTAASAEEALSMIAQDPPDVILSDVGMPGEDGYSLIRRLRRLPKEEGGQVPAVALTAFARAEDRRYALLSGFQMHVPKPVEPAELLAVIASVTNRV